MVAYVVLCCLVFFFGAVVGSFLNVCIYRLPRGLSLWAPRSFCPHCGTPIPVRHNVPIASWIVLRGRAACCGASISPRYLVVEVLGGIGALLSFAAFGLSHAALRAFVLFSALTTAAFLELDRQKAPVKFILLVPVLVLSAAAEGMARIMSSGIGVLLGALLASGLNLSYRLCFKRPFGPFRWLLTTLPLIGAALGTEGLVFSAMAAPAAAALTAAALLLSKHLTLSDPVPISPGTLAATALFLTLQALTR